MQKMVVWKVEQSISPDIFKYFKRNNFDFSKYEGKLTKRHAQLALLYPFLHQTLPKSGTHVFVTGSVTLKMIFILKIS